MRTLIRIAFAIALFAPSVASGQGTNGAADLYKIAYTKALEGQTDSAFVYLHRSIDAGFDAYDHVLTGDPDLASLRKHARWAEVVQKIEARRIEDRKRFAELPDAIKPFADVGTIGYLEALHRLQEMRRQYPGAPSSWASLLSEVLAWTYALVGDDRAASLESDADRTVHSTLPPDFETYTPRSARETIVEGAKKTSIVIINEGHHVPMHRVLTRELLADLYDIGYRYFAVEAVHSGVDTKAPGFPKVKGGYTADPVFADLLRTAIALGYQIISYDTSAPGCEPRYCFTARDSLASRKLHGQTFARDSNAKVLAHVGYSHAVERHERVKPLAMWLANLTGHDPLTVDQTQMMERPDSLREDPEYRRAAAKGWLSMPVVLQKPDGTYYRSSTGGFYGVDMQVFSPRTQRRYGRPQWLERLDRTIVDVRHLVPADTAPVLVQAFMKGADESTDVPFDQVITTGREPVGLALGKGEYVIVVRTRHGFIAQSRLSR